MFLRVARHTNDLKKIEDFYVNILGFELLGGFDNHNNYDGIFIGKSGLDWHFEFTQSNTKAKHSFDEDDITVLYPKSILDYNELIKKISHQNIETIAAVNPFWNENGTMIQDPDGYRIIISPLKAVISEIE
ncbi:VOC family protein [Flavobacterium johnsoniae]|jgi:catechol 2,3-dioxygenase-like lactoylglutathione lyase family enzyme|uniref:Glyoxalase/bleomycin resistance protein/dioxygenase n=1 Tax=Flavobacterium johnsoniae (strain ATCC 17061 / DSM 2064 / JCM 8514 / BCRC 14874 / CCUG 350202 / NBRC 14942 / NCIMB 11054 / UW101) TaxID=376686 RepID=A5FG11_FLAJ1|nr:VOC family protein [Flavobacterium johnsoniae]ABQ05858.1 Glyoxalase/bleomycin resistance protein/dioxygenase [Flavobacterium johnsoniae UW101]OXG01097.1 prolyl endopeptidase [Flavobacterium johnsoniae UW101]WQG81594.1 VOC family protein [Flavobacterium johnsoniae UW101]SHK58172.1 Glyoxalase/Bleomycin resistance protein/Dioxygenase superfamily protein [Flavobacterium johnsoniae]